MNHSVNLGCKRLLGILLVLLLAASPVPVRADDTELYFNPAPPDAPPPLVMLTLDWRPNLGSTYCSDASATSCRDKMGQEIYDALDLGPQSGGLYTTTRSVNLFETFRAVFRLVFESGAFDGMRLGLMMNHNDCLSGGSCGSKSNGGYVLRGFEEFMPGDTNGAKQELLEIFAAIPTYADEPGSPEHKYQGRELFFELYRYLAGLDIVNGHTGFADFKSSDTTRNLDNELFPSDNPGPPSNDCKPADVTAMAGMTEADLNALSTTDPDLFNRCVNRAGSARISRKLRWDTDIETPAAPGGTRYISPYKSGEDWSCSGAYSINMLFQVSQQEADSDGAIGKPLADQGLALPSGGSDKGFPPMIAKLHQMDIAGGQVPGVVPNVAGLQNLTSYFLVDKVNTKTNEYAEKGGTTNAIEALSDPRDLLEALKDIAGQINAVSSSYVAVTVPVNADNRVTSLPNLFVALFQVDANGKPLWPGNVKKLDIVTTTSTLDGSKELKVLDALGNPAFNSVTGRIDDNRLTLWTDPSGTPSAVDKYFPADTTKGEVSGRDGSSVRRGGAGHKIPNYIAGTGVGETNATGARQIFLEPATVTGTAAAGNPMVALDASSGSTLRTDATIQDLLGIRDTSGTGTCLDRDVDNYCVTFIDEVLTAAGQATTSPDTADKAAVATRLFLRWIRGFDVFNEGAVTTGTWDGLTTTAQRKWLMGDVLHSRPLAVNYGARGSYGTDNQDVRLIFGANDGLLRMVRNTASGTSPPSATTQQGAAYGQEVWAFMPRELLAHVPTLAMTTSNVGLNRPYGADGPPALFTIDTNGDGIVDNDGSCTVGADDCDRAWIYFGLRRGGKSYYAVDISDPDATTPKLMWKLNSTTTGFAELGLTFSSPRVGWVRFEDVTGVNQFTTGTGASAVTTNVPVPVVIFGGGYHGHAVTSGDHHEHATGGPSKDTILGTPFTGNDPQGNAIYIVHARTGQLIWKATLGSGSAIATNFQAPEMKHGIAAPVSPMDADGDGILDRLYVADTGGRVWRVDIPEFVPGATPATTRAGNWKATLLADLRPSDTALAASTDDDLRFFHAATIVRRARDGIGVYDAIAVGSGDREHPQSETNKNNWFFLFKDRRVISGDTTSFAAYKPIDLKDVTDACFTGSVAATCSTSDLSKGWRLALEETGEKNLSEPFIGGNGIIFTTYLPQGVGPDDAKCVPLGTSRLYQVGLDKGEPLRFLHSVVGGTFSKTDRWINLYSGIDGGVVAVSPDFWITATGKSGKNPPQKPIQFYWRESGVDAVK